MFPRIKRTRRNGRTYEYLVVSESVRNAQGRSTTRDVATLGNVAHLDKNNLKGLIDGLLRLFQIDEYGLSEQVEILCSLEHGSLLLWRHLWQRLGLSEAIRDGIEQKQGRVKIDVAKYVEMMVVNRCVNPLSKLATSRWIDTTAYRQLAGYCSLPREVEYFYRSMDYLLKAKDPIEKAIYKRLRNLFSVNVCLTFYDITSTFFYGGHCPLAAHGYSRDTRPDKIQIVIGVVTTYEGYPIKHYVFEGNRQDQSTVAEVVKDLRQTYHIEETIFVGDRGMISRLNLDCLEGEGYDYIMGVKARQDEMMPMVLEDDRLFGPDAKDWKGLKITERMLTVKEFLMWKMECILNLTAQQRRSRAWKRIGQIIAAADNDTELTLVDFRPHLKQLTGKDLKTRQRLGRLINKYRGRYADTIRLVCVRNPNRAKQAAAQRTEKLSALSTELDQLFGGQHEDLSVRLEKVFEGNNGRYRGFFKWQTPASGKEPRGYNIDQEAVAKAAFYDGVFVLNTNRLDLSAEEVVAAYKNLREVEMLFDDLKHFVDIHPVRHWLERRVRSHVFLCILGLLNKRVLEIDCLGGKAVTETLETVAQSKLVQYRVRMSERSTHTKTFWKVTTPTAQQLRCFAAVGINKPQCLEGYVW